MDDQFLRDLKTQPSSEFAARLRATLRAAPPNAVARVAPAAALKKWFAAAASIAVVGLVFTLPPVQAAAEAFHVDLHARELRDAEQIQERLCRGLHRRQRERKTHDGDRCGGREPPAHSGRRRDARDATGRGSAQRRAQSRCEFRVRLLFQIA